MKNIFRILTLLSFTISYFNSASSHGFQANTVKIEKRPNGLFRVVIQYTHVSIGEFREAHAEFKTLNEASKFAQNLISGADFFLGKIKESVHFHKDGNKLSPF